MLKKVAVVAVLMVFGGGILGFAEGGVGDGSVVYPAAHPEPIDPPPPGLLWWSNCGLVDRPPYRCYCCSETWCVEWGVIGWCFWACFVPLTTRCILDFPDPIDVKDCIARNEQICKDRCWGCTRWVTYLICHWCVDCREYPCYIRVEPEKPESE
jgi:hypothetical protein